MDLSIRPAAPGDAPAMSWVLAHSWRYAYKNIVNDAYLFALPDDHWVGFLEAGMQLNNLHCLVALDGEAMAGVCVLRPSLLEWFPEDGEMVCLYLLPQYLEQGLGHALVEQAQELLRQKGYTHCVLDVLADNARAIRFYTAHGFAETGHTQEAQLGDQTLLCKVLRAAL